MQNSIMDETAIEGNDTALQEEEVSTVEQAKPLTLEEIRKARVEKLTPKPEVVEESKEVEEEQPAEEASEAEETEPIEVEETTEEVGESEGVLSQIDWDELDDDSRSEIAIQAMEILPPDKLGELAKKMGSGSGKRIGELTSQIKELKGQLASKDKALESGIESIITPSNGLASITSHEKLDEIEAETKNHIRYYQNWLAGDEDSFEHNGKEYSRSDVVTYISGLQDKYDELPKQRRYLRKLEVAQKEAEEINSKAKEEFSWLNDDASETYAEYQKMIQSEDLAIVSKIAPALMARLKYQLAHAASNMVKPKTTRKKKIIIPKKVPQNAVGGSSASNSRQTKETNQLKKLKEAAQRGNLIAARQLRQQQINARYQ